METIINALDAQLDQFEHAVDEIDAKMQAMLTSKVDLSGYKPSTAVKKIRAWRKQWDILDAQFQTALSQVQAARSMRKAFNAGLAAQQ